MASMFSPKNAFLKTPCGISFGIDNDMYISDCERHLIFRIFKNQSMSIIGGTGVGGFNADGYHSLQTLFNSPSSLSVALNGDLYVADTLNSRIRIVSALNGMVSSIATSSSFNEPLGVAVSANNMVYVADTKNNLVKKYDILTSSLTTIGGERGYLDGSYGNVDANTIIMKSPKNIHVVSNGKEDTVYFTDEERVKSIDSNGKYQIVDGLSPQSNLFGIFVTSTNEIWTCSSSSHFVQMKSVGSSTRSTIIGQEGIFGYEGDDLVDSYSKVKFYNPTSLVVKNSIIYLVDQTNNCIRKIDTTQKIVSTFSGGEINHPFGEDIGKFETSNRNNLRFPFMYKNELYFIESTQVVRKVSNGLVKTVLGSSSKLAIENSPKRTNLGSLNDLFIFPNGDMMLLSDSSNIYLYQIETDKLSVGIYLDGNTGISLSGIGNSFSNGTLVLFSGGAIRVYKNGYSAGKYTGLVNEITSNLCVINENGNRSLIYLDAVKSNTILKKINLEVFSASPEIIYSSSSSFTGLSCENDKLYLSQQANNYELRLNESKLVLIAGIESNTTINGYNGENIEATQSYIPSGIFRANSGAIFTYSDTYIQKISNGFIETIVGITPARKVGQKLPLFARDSANNVIYYIDRFTLKKYNETSGEITSLSDSAKFLSAIIYQPQIPFFGLVIDPLLMVYSSYDNSLLIYDLCFITQVFLRNNMKVKKFPTSTSCATTTFTNSSYMRYQYIKGMSVNSSNGDIYITTRIIQNQNSGFSFLKIEKQSGLVFTLFTSFSSNSSSDGLVTSSTSFGEILYSYVESENVIYYCTESLLRVIEKKDDGNYYLRTIVGNGNIGYSGDGLPALGSSLYSPISFHIKKNGDIIILDGSYIIRKFDNKTGLLTTLAGNPNQKITQLSGDLSGKDTKFIGFSPSIAYNEETEQVYFIESDFRIQNSGAPTISTSFIRRLTVSCEGNSIFNSFNSTCDCLKGYYGSKCEALSCNGTLSDSSSVCNGNGQCVDLNVCTCKQGFKGQYCEVSTIVTENESSTILIISITIPIVASLLILVILLIVIFVIVGCFLSKKKKNKKNNNELATINTSTIELSDFPTGSTIISSTTGSTASDTEDLFSKYTNIVRIGQGAFGSVFKCTDSKNQVKALKVVKFESFTDLNTIMKEASQLSNIRHPNILKVNDYFITNDNILCMDMNYFENGDLTRFLKTDLCSEEIFQKILKQLLSALNYVHSELSIIHRDIKPSNIFIGNFSEHDIHVVLADFGLAKKYQEMKGQSYAGTPLYMSPEIALGSSYSFNTDIFSLGVSIYQIMTRDETTSISNLLMGAQSANAQSILKKQMSNCSVEYSDELIEIVLQMLDKNQQTRPNANQLLKLPYFK